MTQSRLLSLALFLVSAGISVAADKPKITLDEFFNYVSYDAVQISPDGNSVVIGVDRADWDRQIFQSDLWLYRDGGSPAQGSLFQLTQSGHDYSPRWSPDGRWIAFLSDRDSDSGKSDSDDASGDNSEKSVSQIYLISPSGGEAFAITFGDQGVHAFCWSPDSKTLYFATRVPWDKQQKDAHRKVWKDTIQYRAGERGDLIYSLDVSTALTREETRGARETPKKEKEANTTLTANEIAATPWRV
ncbi:MAG TPA: hypothetical protein VK466_11465, partial [Terriglobales bacterium]|nr:hypothetical protein [Terriglobales bacterium]